MHGIDILLPLPLSDLYATLLFSQLRKDNLFPHFLEGGVGVIQILEELDPVKGVAIKKTGGIQDLGVGSRKPDRIGVYDRPDLGRKRW